MKQIFYLLACMLMATATLHAQDSLITVGTRHTFFSKVLQEERAYWVSLPEGFDASPSKRWPVLYLLDGDVFFQSVVGFTRFFSAPDALPCVVVAVLNVDRTRDFTPTRSAARRDGTIHPEDQPAGGQAATFRRFLVEELRTEVERRYPHAGGRNYLMGHSYAGLFTLCTLLDAPESFDAYIAVDPSLWWDRNYVVRHASQQAHRTRFDGKRLYVAFATHPRPERQMVNFPRTNDFLKTIVPQLQQRGLYVVSRKFPDEVHGTVALPGFYDGLKQLFPRPQRIRPDMPQKAPRNK